MTRKLVFYPIPNGVLYTNIVENSIRDNIIGTQRTFRNGVTHHYRRNDYMLAFPVAPYIMFFMIKSIIQQFEKQIQNGFGPEELDLVLRRSVGFFGRRKRKNEGLSTNRDADPGRTRNYSDFYFFKRIFYDHKKKTNVLNTKKHVVGGRELRDFRMELSRMERPCGAGGRARKPTNFQSVFGAFASEGRKERTGVSFVRAKTWRGKMRGNDARNLKLRVRAAKRGILS